MNVMLLHQFLRRSSRRAPGRDPHAGVHAAGLGSPVAAQVAIPNFWDPRAQLERPDLTGLRTIRFLVDDDFPPLHFSGLDGNPTGFSVELARAACERLAITCTVQVRRFDMLLDALGDRQGDVVAAAIPINARSLRERFAVTAPYFKIPGPLRGQARQEPAGAARPSAWRGKRVGGDRRTAHEAFAKAFCAGHAQALPGPARPPRQP